MKYNPEKREQVIPLKDGRTLFKTHNGFENWVESAKGEVTKVSANYYNKCKANKV